jgi:membrane protein DedA with SNARE-associated domain
MEILLSQYGYLLIFVITLFEGETVLIISGILASQGFLNIELSILSAFLGSTIGDQMFFHFARHEGYRFVKKFKYVWAVLPRAEKLVKRHGIRTVLFARYLYGLRLGLVVMCGLVKMPVAKFSLYNAGAALVWAVSYGFLGYFFSVAIVSVVGLKVEAILPAAIGIAAIIYWISRTASQRRIQPTDSSKDSKSIAEKPNGATGAPKQEE